MKKPFLLFGIALTGVFLFSWIYLPSLSKYHDLKQQEEELDQQIEKFERDVEATLEERNLLKNDPEYLEKVIRDEMGLVKPGEIVYKFVQDQPGQMEDEEIDRPEPVPPPALAASPSRSPSSVTVEAHPVHPKPAAASAPRSINLVAPVPAKKTLPPPNAEPVYPRKETR